MGGQAFQNAVAPDGSTLHTPRMTPAEYAHLKATYLAKIRAYLQTLAEASHTSQDKNGETEFHVTSLLEAPEKTDYGDIDILIAYSRSVDFRNLANAIHAAGFVYRGPDKCSLAVHKDGSPSSHPTVVYKDKAGKCSPSAPVRDGDYAQIDLDLIEPHHHPWFRFYSSYGDMVGLLGRIVRPMGFKVNDVGFWLRLKELEHAKKLSLSIPDADGLIFLSQDPRAVMEFLHLSPDAFEAGLETIEQLFTWLSKCRLICPEGIARDRLAEHVRKWEWQRQLYPLFFNEWLPARVDMSLRLDEREQKAELDALRSTLQSEAIDVFAKRDEFDTKQRAIILRVRNAVAANLLRPLVVKHSARNAKSTGEILRAFRRFVRFDDTGKPVLVDRPVEDVEAQLYRFLAEDGETLRDAGEVDRWVEAHWEEVRSMLRQYGKS